MKIFRRSLIGIFLAVVLFSMSGGTAEAADFVGEDNYTLPAGETVNDDLYVAGDTIVIDGDINGDLFAAGGTVTINGDISGNLFVGGGQVTINSNVAGDIFAAGGTLSIKGTADDVRVAGGEVTMNGQINGDMMTGGARIELNGKVNGDAFVGTDSLTFGESAKVGGKLSYATPAPLDEASRVAGEAEHFESNTDIEVNVSPPSIRSIFSGWFTRTLLTVAGYVLLTWLVLTFRPNWLDRPVSMLNNDWGKSAGWGVIYLIAVPIATIILVISMGIVFGIGASIATLFVIFSLNFIISFVTPIIAGTWLGNQFTESGTTGILVTVAVLALLFALPLVGSIIKFVAFVLIMGSLLLMVRQTSEPIKVKAL